jgi:hypothetical protein
MITYLQVYNRIKTALTSRPQGTRVEPLDHEEAEIMILDYVEQVKNQSSGSVVREAHSVSLAGVNCNLVWNAAFADTNYSYTINGFDSRGNPVMIYLVSKSMTKIVIKTLAGATVSAIAIPNGINL